MITFTCPQCRRNFQLDDDFAGKMGKCNACGAMILVPSATAIQPTVPTTPQYAPPSAYAPAYPQQPQRFSQPAPHPDSQPAPQPFYGQPQAYQQPYQQPGNAVGYPTQPQPQYGQPSPLPDPSGAARVSVRLKRLQAEALQVQKAFANSTNIRVHSVHGEPPERYVIEYRVRGLVRGPQGPVFQDQHFAEIQLTSEYPRQSPKCRMLTPIFHPNFEPATICVGDHWTAGERLVDLIIRIAEMVAFQAYNIKSPLDGEAAMWSDQNRQHLPTDHRDLRPPDLA